MGRLGAGKEGRRSNLGLSFTGHEQTGGARHETQSGRREEEVNFEANSSVEVQLVLRPDGE